MGLEQSNYKKLLDDIGVAIHDARHQAVKAVTTELVKANWEIGRHIVKYEQHGNERAEYGSGLLSRLSKDLRTRYGKGFGRRNVLDMRRSLLLTNPKSPSLNSWHNIFSNALCKGAL